MIALSCVLVVASIMGMAKTKKNYPIYIMTIVYAVYLFISNSIFYFVNVEPNENVVIRQVSYWLDIAFKLIPFLVAAYYLRRKRKNA